jgi:CD2 antigen cytoplasmic tail-binding protein 2
MPPKSVRFATNAKRPRDSQKGSDGKAKRFRQNEDELDDIDDWKEEDGDNKELDSVVPSERELLEAKRRRRRKRTEGIDEDDTNIDESTSLATEGVTIEPFSMRNEETDGTGYFDGDTYVWRKNDPNDEPDAWLDSLEDSTTGNSGGKLASQNSTAAREAPAVSKIKRKNEKESSENLTKEELYMKILPLISDKETITQAVRRYGQVAKQNKNGKKNSEISSSGEACKLAKTYLDELTGLASALLLKGEVNIYDTRRQNILKFIPLHHQQKPLPPTKGKQDPVDGWEYLGNQDGKIHGPYTTKQMFDWMASGYFLGPSKVKIRSIKKKPLSTQDDLLADLMDDDGDNSVSVSEKSDAEKGEWKLSDDINMADYM